jgi:hypothetical protein
VGDFDGRERAREEKVRGLSFSSINNIKLFISNVKGLMNPFTKLLLIYSLNTSSSFFNN